MASETSHLLAHTTDSDDDGAGPSRVTAPPANQASLPRTNTASSPDNPPPLRGADETQPLRSVPPVPLTRLKTVVNAYIMWFPFGFFGFHHFYLKNISIGFNYMFTFGLFGFGWFVDFWRIPMLVKAANAEIEAKWIWEHEIAEVPNRDEVPEFKYEKPKRLSDCYLLGFTTGFLGFHQHYLGRHVLGLVYIFTFGLFIVGVVSDWIRMPIHLKRYNQRLSNKLQGIEQPPRYYLDDAYVFAVPGGIFGFHNFYLGRYFWGIVYLLTLGVLGMGWVVDLIRMPFLVEEANHRAKAGRTGYDGVEEGTKYQSVEEDFPRINPYYSDYNSGQSQCSVSQSDTSASAGPATSRSRPARPKRSVSKPRHFKEFLSSTEAEPTAPSQPQDDISLPSHSSGGVPEPPPPYAPVADPGSALPNDETEI
ncbi:uncharacterized protein LOC119729810 [Patiria miniata]|uniref:TM2 domain-containing protein n=1 Tax=Patiria miniata TaxID=46514 RepID=A0A914A3V1_PATMI|nr:uncharacterized protein LOC119729810 [Patiria miniata]